MCSCSRGSQFSGSSRRRLRRRRILSGRATDVGTTYSFGLRALHGDATDVVSGRVMVGTSRRRTLSRATLRKAIRRGTLTVRVRRVKGRRVRLMVRVDDRRPSSPPQLASAGGAGAATLSWGRASDDVGVTAYRIARDGTTVATLPGAARSWSDSGLQVGRTYRYTARAVDRVGKRSLPATTTVTVTAAGAVQAPGGAAAPSPSGQAIPAADLPGWQLTFPTTSRRTSRSAGSRARSPRAGRPTTRARPTRARSAPTRPRES